MTVLFRTESDPLTLLPTVRQAVQTLNADLPVFDARTMDNQLATKLATQRLSAILVSLFSVLALILAAVGLYGVLAYSIAQRTREIGIRIALGAESQSILGSDPARIHNCRSPISDRDCRCHLFNATDPKHALWRIRKRSRHHVDCDRYSQSGGVAGLLVTGAPRHAN
jgi:FtsX-like permease family protein